MNRKYWIVSFVFASCLDFMGPASFAEESLSFQPVTLSDEEFQPYPNQSSDGLVIARGAHSGPLQISHDHGDTFQNFNVPDIEPFNNGDQSDWYQVSVSPDGNHIVAASARGNSGGYIFLSHDSGTSFSSQAQIGNANWIGAIFGSNSSEILALDGVATIRGGAADGSNCRPDPELCIGSGEDGSNLQGFSDGGMVRQEQPFAAAYYSNNGGDTWSKAITLPSGSDGVAFAVTSLGARFILRKSALDIDGNYLNEYFELTGFQRAASATLRESEEARESAIRAAEILLSKQEIIQAIGAGSEISTSTLSKAGLNGVSTLTSTYFNNEIAKLTEAGPLSFETVRAIHEKWACAEKVIAGSQFTINDLVTAGFAPAEMPFKATVLRTLRDVPLSERDTPAKIQALIQATLLENKTRRDRVKARILNLK